MVSLRASSLFYTLLTAALAACGGGGGASETPTAGGSPSPSPTAIASPAPSPSPSPSPSPIPTPTPVQKFTVSANLSFEVPRSGGVHACNTPRLGAGSSVYFSEIAVAAGMNYSHSVERESIIDIEIGGAAATDIDGDGLVDVYAIGGPSQANLLLRNRGDGSFEDIADSRNLALMSDGSGPAFGDFNGDGLQDVFIGSRRGDAPMLLLNEGELGFRDILDESGLVLPGNNVSAAWSDYDNDGDLDLIVSHWDEFRLPAPAAYIWRNNGDLSFSDATDAAGVRWYSAFGSRPAPYDYTFAPILVDLNGDGHKDLLMTADYNLSRVYLNVGGGRFANVTNDTISDLNGMGSTAFDYDNDGDIDWFVSAIFWPDGVFGEAISQNSGNRLYANVGEGIFEDKTNVAGVRLGGWGWGACHADFDNSTYFDIFHVNGFEELNPVAFEPWARDLFLRDSSKLFMANGDLSFSELSYVSGIADYGQGRGVLCFDYDRDGDVDIFVANSGEPPALFCNHGNDNNFINIRFADMGVTANVVGVVIKVRAGSVSMMQELYAGSGYVSQAPMEAHFGLGSAETVDELRVEWPDGGVAVFNDLDANQFVVVHRE